MRSLRATNNAVWQRRDNLVATEAALCLGGEFTKRNAHHRGAENTEVDFPTDFSAASDHFQFAGLGSASLHPKALCCRPLPRAGIIFGQSTWVSLRYTPGFTLATRFAGSRMIEKAYRGNAGRFRKIPPCPTSFSISSSSVGRKWVKFSTPLSVTTTTSS